ncbi:MAG: ATP-binding protein [Candidatus Neptunochlamydia sp.]|nr:ATP-binding protein [Candidatus Neptunochlamydia sp.]
MEKEFAAELASLHPILDWIRNYLEDTGISDIEIRRIEIALEEGLVNIFCYAYQGKMGNIDISISHEVGSYVEIVFKDTGFPFNPLKHKKEEDLLTPIESLEEGGLGILFMQKLMDKVEYRREGDANILTLRKNLPETPKLF